MQLDKLGHIVKIYSHTYHSTIKRKPVDVKPNRYLHFTKEISNKDPKFNSGDTVRTSKHKNIFAKDYTSNQAEDIFVIKKVKNTVPWNYFINDLNGEEIVETFYEKNKNKNKTNQKEFRNEKVIKRKDDKLYVK